MTFWQYVQFIGATVIICLFLLLVAAGVFEWIALREQNEPKPRDLAEYYREHPDERPKR